MGRFGKSVALRLSLLLCSLMAPAAFAALEAKVDRTTVTAGDSLTLTIRADGSSDDEPDYAPLQQDFEVFGSARSSQHSFVNGRISSSTEWRTTLIPKRSGQLWIPALAVGAEKTQPIALQVREAAAAAHDGSEPVIIEVQTDRDSLYVQQQLLFTVRVLVAVQLDDLQLTKPQFDDASVKQLSETTYRRDIADTPYAVHEISYAIFPQQPGELTIPELVFSAVEVTRSRSLFDFPGQGRTLRKMSRQLRVHVKPVPKTFSGAVWLPARNLTLSSSWSGDPHNLAVGDSVTRSIAIHADGLPAAQLPALDLPAGGTAKIYADQPELDDEVDANGVRGKRVEHQALIPSQPGPLRLPPTKIVWWDVDSDSEKIATLDGETLAIKRGAAARSAPTTAPMPTPTPQRTADETIPPLPAPASARNWQIACAALALLWLATLARLWRERARAPGTQPAAVPARQDNLRENDAWKALQAACRSNDAAQARAAALQWARIFFERADLRSLDALRRIAADAALDLELRRLDDELFGARDGSVAWNGETLLHALKKIREEKASAGKPDDALPGLYPAA